MRRAACIIIAASFFVVPESFARGGVQRMAIARGTYRVPAKSSKAVSAYCVDATRPAPTAATTYDNVLTGGSRAYVVTPTRRAPLSEAITNKWVRIRGRNADFRSRMERPLTPAERARMSPSEHARLESLRKEWREMSPSEQAMFEALANALGGGDHRQLEIENLLQEEIRIELGEPIVAGAEREAGVPVPRDLARSHDPAVQERIWRAGLREHQKLLRDLGYYDGRIDGKAGPRTAEAIKNFQRDFNTGDSLIIDSATEAALRGGDQRRVIAMNKANTRVKTATVEFSNTAPTLSYRLTTAAGTRDVASVREVATLLLADDARGASDLYLDLKGFTPEKGAGFEASFRQHVPTGSKIRVEAVVRGEHGRALTDFVLSPGAKIERIERSASKPLEASVHVRHTVAGKLRRAVVKIFARSAEMLTSALSRLQALLNGSKAISLAEAASQVRAALRAQYPTIKDSDFRMVVHEQTSSVEIAVNEVGSERAA